ncbi:matrixin family metalloprotease [Waterburya agarophytonicola K14]|uniref:Matrixin family metalloprotease n=1 Tax=Waterburya agarophytonicola KI4 TaxID=2874699 RepID=A0A964FEP2_9CYAN|nr:matrixin family metalloprotease [Waterburya agarophytonicola]MCC0176920.1 matrixin family metalloprotease [Waterburya agarophytonicola KI4]
MNKWRLKWQKLVYIAIATCLIVFISQIIIVLAQPTTANLPPSKVHTLPESLKTWEDKTNSGNYFSRIDSTPLGYLVWSHFPVTVYVQQPLSLTDSSADKRFQQWVNAVKKAIAEWNVYLPLEEITKRERADIVILRSQPPRETKLNRDTGLYDIPRAVTAETNYKFYIKQNPATITHKMKVEISPNYAGVSLFATIRHELGHALGIWGHSDRETDALYFSQVSDPPPISLRDINTLKKIYQHPTKLGWKIDRTP